MSQNIWKKDDRILDLVAKHYNVEQRAANTYFHLATLAKSIGYDYAAKFFYKMGIDKQEAHMTRLINYLMKFDYVLKSDSIIVSESVDFNDIASIFKFAVDTESKVRNSVYKVVDAAFAGKDFETFEAMQWFVRDSIEDLEEINDLATYASANNANMLDVENMILNKLKDKE
ncbi:MAG: hypothetical protein HUJ42_02270 [Malacoplasma sp.]|nr:hypothetical protein [Malacoplasma sp.]